MLEVYSLSTTVDTGIAVPLNNVSVEKGCTAVHSAPATIELNRCGVYMVTCDASLTPSEAGVASIQLTKNGVLQPQAQSTVTGAVDTIYPVGFTTLVQVTENNSPCCCSSPTILQLVNTGVESLYNHINVCVTKIC